MKVAFLLTPQGLMDTALKENVVTVLEIGMPKEG